MRLDAETLKHGDQYCLRKHWSGGSGDRIRAKAGRSRMILDSEAKELGGHGRLIPNQEHNMILDSSQPVGQSLLCLFLLHRTAVVLQVKQHLSG